MSFHAGAHSGRLLRVMIEGSNAMFGALALVLSRALRQPRRAVRAAAVDAAEELAARRDPARLVVVFGAAMNLVIRRTGAMQTVADEASTDLAERVADVFGALPVVQSFARAEEEAEALRGLGARLLAAQFPVLTWWALASVATRASATLALLAIFVAGVWLDIEGLTTIGEIATFMGLATMLIGRLEQMVGFVNFLFAQAPKLMQFFAVLDASSSVADRPGAIAVGRLAGHVRFEGVSFAYAPARAVHDLAFDAPAGRRSRWSARPARASRPRWRCCTASTTRARGASPSTGATFAT